MKLGSSGVFETLLKDGLYWDYSMALKGSEC